MRRLRMVLALAILAVGVRVAAADVGRVDVTVTWVAGESVYLDQGREAGIGIGDLVRIDTATGAGVEARIVSVSKTNSRATVVGPGTVRTGDRGVVLVTADRAPVPVEEKPGADGGPTREVPDHPPWTREMEERGADAPLLAPAFTIPRQDRPVRWRGRIYGQLLASRNDEGDRTADFRLYILGTDLTAENVFGRGGVLEIAGAFDSRTIDVEDLPSDTESDGRIDRLSYRWGVGLDSPYEIRVGRFLPRDWPEIGLVDGAEASFAAGDIGRFAVDLGALPEPLPDRQSLQDVGASISWRTREEPDTTLDVGALFQQTWHEGEVDRTLLIGKTFWRPSREFDLNGSAWVDFYGSNDTVKGSGAELTEFHLIGSWRPAPGSGLRAGLTRILWPEMERYEFPRVTKEQLADSRVTRLDLSGYTDLSRMVRGDARVGIWSDQNDSGVTGRMSITVRELIAHGSNLTFGLFRIDGNLNEGVGGRVDLRQSLPTAELRIGYEVSRVDVETYGGSGETLLLQAIVAGVDWFPDRHWTLSLTGDLRFGDYEGEVALGILAQYRF